MNGWNNWEKDEQNLNLGGDNLSFFNNEPKTVDDIAPQVVPPLCTDSSACGSGYTCVNGECVANPGSPGGGTLAPSFPPPATPGSPSPGFPTGGSPSSSPGTVYPPIGASYPASSGSGVGSGGISGCGQDVDPGQGNNTVAPCGPNPSNNGCTKTGCGQDNQDANDCCGEQRCCRYNGAGVQCWCGPCPPPEKPCSVWCDITKSATGDLWPGCDEEQVCDECSECDGNQCQPNTFDAPCNCEQSACNAMGCEVCGEDGICRKDCDNCQTVWTRGYQCPCGTVTQTCRRSACDPGLTHCTVPDCNDFCLDEPDPCEGSCSTTTICDGSPFSCPSYASCSVAGSINTASAECTIYNVCDKRNLPPECEECDCNCDDDCGDCQICSSAGVCEPDPECDDLRYAPILRFRNAGKKLYHKGCIDGNQPWGRCTSTLTENEVSRLAFSVNGTFKLPFTFKVREPGATMPFYYPSPSRKCGTQPGAGPKMETVIDDEPGRYDQYHRRWTLVDAEGSAIMPQVPAAINGVTGMDICWGGYVSYQSLEPMYEIVYVNGPGVPYRPPSDFDV